MKRRSHIMSKNTAAIELVKTYKYFDLTDFSKKSVEGKTTFTPAANIEEATQRIGGDATKMLNAVNAYLQKETLRELKASVLPADAGDTAVLSSIMKPFRAMAPFNAIGTKDSKGDFLPGERQKQTDAILNMIKGIPALVEQIKIASKDAEDVEETEEKD